MDGSSPMAQDEHAGQPGITEQEQVARSAVYAALAPLAPASRRRAITWLADVLDVPLEP